LDSTRHEVNVPKLLVAIVLEVCEGVIGSNDVCA
jgi:hypothetical protein